MQSLTETERWLIRIGCLVPFISSIALMAWYWPGSLPQDSSSGVWTALAQDFARGVFYRPTADAFGFGGTRYMPLRLVLHAARARRRVVPGVPALRARPRSRVVPAAQLAGERRLPGSRAQHVGDLLRPAPCAPGVRALLLGVRRRVSRRVPDQIHHHRRSGGRVRLALRDRTTPPGGRARRHARPARRGRIRIRRLVERRPRACLVPRRGGRRNPPGVRARRSAVVPAR